MGRRLQKNSTNVRLYIPESWWSVLADWAVGEIPTPSFAEVDPCPSCGAAVMREGRCEQCALEHELFHREERTLSAV